MLVILGSAVGALLGILRARKLGGRKMDALHYGVIFALIGALIGIFATIIIQRTT